MQRYDSYNNQDINSTYNGEAKGTYLRDLIPIPFDPILDPKFGTCFNCWHSGHTFQTCQLPKMCDFCHNCGRLGEKVHTCPRCHQAYQKYRTDRNQSDVEHYQGDVKFHEDHPIEEKSNMSNELKLDEPSIHQNSNIETDDEYFSCEEEEEENYDNFIVDEDQKSSHTVGDLLTEFVDLIRMIKYLPIKTQNLVILHFVAEHRKYKNLNTESLI